MSELLAQLWTPEMQAAFTVVLVLLVILYVLSIVWVVRDAYLRGTAWYIWAVVALVPVLGLGGLLPASPSAAAARSRRAGAGDRAQAAPAHEVRRMRQLRLSRRGGLCPVPELPHAAEEPLHALQPRAGALLDGLPLLRHSRGRPGAACHASASPLRPGASEPPGQPGLGFFQQVSLKAEPPPCGSVLIGEHRNPGASKRSRGSQRPGGNRAGALCAPGARKGVP